LPGAEEHLAGKPPGTPHGRGGGMRCPHRQAREHSGARAIKQAPGARPTGRPAWRAIQTGIMVVAQGQRFSSKPGRVVAPPRPGKRLLTGFGRWVAPLALGDFAGPQHGAVPHMGLVWHGPLALRCTAMASANGAASNQPGTRRPSPHPDLQSPRGSGRPVSTPPAPETSKPSWGGDVSSPPTPSAGE